MASSVEERVVKMTFDNKVFESKVAETMASLAGLDKALQFKDASKGLDSLAKSTSKFDLGGIGDNVGKIASKFSTLGAVAFSAIQTITQGALGMVKKIGGDILAPIISGGTKRAKNIEQAKFMFEGLGIDVQKGMDSALKAVKGTAYGLDDAARAGAQFAASGVKVGDEMTGALRAVAGTAAMTGTSFSEMARVFAGSAGANKVTNQDFLQFATRGLNAAAAYGKQIGKTEAQVHEMAKNGEIDFKSFASAMDKAFGAHSQEANKTFEGSLANMHAAMSRLGAAFIGPELEQFRDLFNAITPVIDNITTALGPLLKLLNQFSKQVVTGIIKTLNGMKFDNLTKAIPHINAGLTNIFNLLKKLLGIGKDAFKDIFPGRASSLLVSASIAFEKLTKYLTLSSSAAARFKLVFEGIFAIFRIVYDIIKGLVTVIADLISHLLGVSSGKILTGFASIGEFFKNLEKGTLSSKNIEHFFSNITDAIDKVIAKIKEVTGHIVEFFKGPKDTGKVGGAFGEIEKGAGKAVDAVSKIGNIWGPIERTLAKVGDVLARTWNIIWSWLKNLGQLIANNITPAQFSMVTDALNTAFIGAITAFMYKFMRGGVNLNFFQNFAESLGKSLDSLTGTLDAMQQKLKAEALMKIAEAIGILTASLFVLSTIDPKKLSAALAAMAAGFGELIGVFAAVTKISGATSGIKFDLLAAGMIALSTAALILSGAVKVLATLSWEELGRGLSAMLGLFTIMVGVAQLLEGKAATMIAAGVGMMAIANALLILAAVLKIFGQMPFAEMGRGFAAVAVGLLIIAGAMRVMPKGMGIQAIGLLLVATSLKELQKVMAAFAGMSWGGMAKGMAGIAGGLVIIAGAMRLMPPTMPLIAAGLILVGASLLLISKAMASMGGMSWAEIGRGLTVMAGALILLAAACYAMSESIVGAAAIGVAALSLIVLAKAMKAFASISWGDLLHGLAALAIALAGVAIAAVLISPAIPYILALGAALLVIGAAFALFGAGVLAVGLGFEMLAKFAKDGSKGFVDALKSMGAAIPAFATGFALALVELVKVLGKFIPVLVKVILDLVGQLLDGLVTIIPKAGKVIETLILTILSVIKTYIPNLVLTGIQILVAILTGIRDNIGQVVTLVGEIITNFLNAMATQLSNIVQSVANLIITFFTSVANAVGKVAGTLMFGIGLAFMQGFLDGVLGGQSGPAKWFAGLAARVIGWIGNVVNTLRQKGIDFITGLYNGVIGTASRVSSWFSQLAGNILRWIGNTAGTLIGKGRDLISGLYNGVSGAVGSISGWFARLAGNILAWVGNLAGLLLGKGHDIMTGLYNGITSGWNTVAGWISGIPGRVSGAFGNVSGILRGIGESIMGGLLDGIMAGWNKVAGTLSSLGQKIKDLKGPPEADKVMLIENGKLIMQGLQKGIEDEWANVAKWLSQVDPSAQMDKNLGDRMAGVLNNAITDMIKQIENMPEVSPVITPVLDLTNVAAGAKQIADYIKAPQITPTFSYAQAQNIASSASAVQTTDPAAVASSGGAVKFEQNIYAPTQLSTSDIYKNTRNQITMAKKELSIP